MMVVIIAYPYQKIAGILKWFCLSILLYLIVPFIIKVNWKDVLIAAFVPRIELNKDFIEMMVAILGTTISPYLFFWQATMEAEDEVHQKKQVIVDKRVLRNMAADVNTGMFPPTW
jgi:Mn2+/Fe2+ NRAMP family transporter